MNSSNLKNFSFSFLVSLTMTTLTPFAYANSQAQLISGCDPAYEVWESDKSNQITLSSEAFSPNRKEGTLETITVGSSKKKISECWNERLFDERVCTAWNIDDNKSKDFNIGKILKSIKGMNHELAEAYYDMAHDNQPVAWHSFSRTLTKAAKKLEENLYKNDKSKNQIDKILNSVHDVLVVNEDVNRQTMDFHDSILHPYRICETKQAIHKRKTKGLIQSVVVDYKQNKLSLDFGHLVLLPDDGEQVINFNFDGERNNLSFSSPSKNFIFKLKSRKSEEINERRFKTHFVIDIKKSKRTEVDATKIELTAKRAVLDSTQGIEITVKNKMMAKNKKLDLGELTVKLNISRKQGILERDTMILKDYMIGLPYNLNSYTVFIPGNLLEDQEYYLTYTLEKEGSELYEPLKTNLLRSNTF